MRKCKKMIKINKSQFYFIALLICCSIESAVISESFASKERLTLTGQMTITHNHPMVHVEFVEGHPQILCVSEDRAALYDRKSGKEKWRFNSRQRKFEGAQVVPGEKSIIIWTSWEVYLVALETGGEIKRFDLPMHGNTYLRRAVVHPENPSLLFLEGNKTLNWGNMTGSKFTSGPVYSQSLIGIGLSPDMKSFVFSDRSGLAIQNMVTKKVIALSRYRSWVNPPLFSQDSQTVLIDGRKEMTLLNTANGHTLQKFLLPKGELTASAFSADKRFVANGNRDGGITLWSTDTGLKICMVSVHEGELSTLAFNHEGLWELLSGGNDGKAVLWEISPEVTKSSGIGTPPSVPRLNIQQGQCAESAAISKNGQTALTGGGSKAILWHSATGRSLRTFVAPEDNNITSMAISPDGKYGLVGYLLQGLARVWDLETGEEVIRLGGHDGVIHDVAFSPDGRYILTAQGNSSTNISHLGKTATLWNAKTGKLIRRYNGHEKGITSIAFSSDSKMFLSGSRDKTAILWEVETGKEIRRFTGNTDEVTCVDISPDGRFCLTGSQDDIVRLWDLSLGTEARKFQSFQYRIFDVAFTGIKDKIIIADGIGIHLVDIKTGELEEFIDRKQGKITDLAVSADNDHLITGGCKYSSRIRNIRTLRTQKRLKPTSSRIENIACTKDMRSLTVSHQDYSVSWDLRKGKIKKIIDFDIEYPFGTTVQTSTDGTKVLIYDVKKIRVLDMDTGKKHVVNKKPPQDPTIAKGKFSVDNKYIILPDSNTAGIIDAETGQLISQLNGHESLKVNGKVIDYKDIRDTAFSPNNEYVVSAGSDSTIRLWRTRTGKEIRMYKDFPNLVMPGISISHLAFLPDGKRFLAVVGNISFDQIVIFDISETQPKQHFKIDENVKSIALSKDGKLLLAGYKDKTAKLWNMETGGLIHVLSGHDGYVHHVNISPDGRLLFTANKSALMIWDTDTGRMMAQLMAFKDGYWAVVDEQGHYDSNHPGDLPQLSWIMPDEPMTPYPIELFMKDYFEPGLLPKLLAGEALPQVSKLSEIIRVQPQVEIIDISLMSEDQPESVRVTVEAKPNKKQIVKSGKTITQETGVYDLRLFRDGQLVGYAPNKSGKLTLNPETGKSVVTFNNIKLPTASKKDSVLFSAYAFNVDGVKSLTHKMKYKLSKQIIPRKPRAYVIVIGVNAYENPAWNLRYAANDARVYTELIQGSLESTAQFEKVVVISLVSDHGDKHALSAVHKESKPVKALLKAVFDMLSGHQPDPRLRAQIASSGQIRDVYPDDLVFISYSGHGMTDNQNDFHLFPYDIGTGNERIIDDTLLKKTISSRELSLWLRDIDAGTFVMIIDACNSAASVEGKGFKPGPMGSRGLGQLAYDKGMRILTASQAESVALESRLIRHGVLSYALLKEGIEWQMADAEPKNRQIMIGEWLNYGLNRVPTLYEEIQDGQLTQNSNLTQGRGKILYLNNKINNRSGRKIEGQLPGLFDFAKQPSEKILCDKLQDRN